MEARSIVGHEGDRGRDDVDDLAAGLVDQIDGAAVGAQICTLSNMRSTPRRAHEVLSDAAALTVLRQIATGGGIDHDLLGVELGQLRADGLIDLLPRRQVALTPRGRVLLEAANGECACPPEDD